MFQDRRDAGRRLARLVAQDLRGDADPPVVVGLARGGLPVAAQVADHLRSPLDVMIVRKLGCPWQPELGVGAIAEDGFRILNDALIDDIGLEPAALDAVIRREQKELERRVRLYRGDRPPVPVRGRTVILIDDGLATGYTARAAIGALRARGATQVILAVPVAPADTVRALGSVADRVVALDQPDRFMAIGAFYADFSQTSDHEVTAILEAHRAQPS